MRRKCQLDCILYCENLNLVFKVQKVLERHLCEVKLQIIYNFWRKRWVIRWYKFYGIVFKQQYYLQVSFVSPDIIFGKSLKGISIL